MTSRWTSAAIAAVAVLGLSLGSAEAGGIRKPGGVGANIHRSFMIKRAYKLSQQGRRAPKHVGIWNAGGYRQTTGWSGRRSSGWRWSR